jgi:hypothetical protein
VWERMGCWGGGGGDDVDGGGGGGGSGGGGKRVRSVRIRAGVRRRNQQWHTGGRGICCVSDGAKSKVRAGSGGRRQAGGRQEWQEWQGTREEAAAARIIH